MISTKTLISNTDISAITNKSNPNLTVIDIGELLIEESSIEFSNNELISSESKIESRENILNHIDVP